MSDENTGTATETTDFAAEVAADMQVYEETSPEAKARAAVKEALAGIEGEIGGEEVAEPVAQPPAVDENKEFLEERSRVAKVLKDRDRVFQERQKANEERESVTREAMRMRAEAEALVRQAREQAQWVAALKTDPVKALKAAGVDPEEWIMRLATEGTPQGKQERELAELKRQAEEWKEYQRSQEEERTKAQERAQIEQRQQFRQSVETQFLTSAKSEKYSNLSRAIADGVLTERALLVEGDYWADKYREAANQEASLEDILEYIDGRFSKVYGSAKAAPSTGASVPGKPPVSVKKASRTLTAADASERRVLEVPPSSDAGGDERLQRARAAVQAVLKRSSTTDE